MNRSPSIFKLRVVLPLVFLMIGVVFHILVPAAVVIIGGVFFFLITFGEIIVYMMQMIAVTAIVQIGNAIISSLLCGMLSVFVIEHMRSGWAYPTLFALPAAVHLVVTGGLLAFAYLIVAIPDEVLVRYYFYVAGGVSVIFGITSIIAKMFTDRTVDIPAPRS